MRKGLMVDEGATSHLIKDISKFKTFDVSFHPDNHFIELSDGTRIKGGDAEICLVDMDGNHATVSLKGALYILFYPQNIPFYYVCPGKRGDYNIQEK